MIYKTTGKSLLELREIYGVGSSGFYDTGWWLNEEFAKEKPKAGTFEIDFDDKHLDMTYDEQIKAIGNKKPLHPAQLAEIVLTHYKKTGKRLLENWYSRTSVLTSDGVRVYVGRFDARGLLVNDDWGGSRRDLIGLAVAREVRNSKSGKLDSLESLKLRVEALEDFKEKVEKIINL